MALNTLQAPFDNENVRLAFHLAVDRQAVVDALGDLTARPAPGVVPYGVSDYSSSRPVVEAPVQDDGPTDPIIAGPEQVQPSPTCWDFRTHSLEVVTAEHSHDYETDRLYAQALLAQAGYPGGAGFPEVEYLYSVEQENGRALAEMLRTMWKDALGVTITIRGVSEEEYETALLPVLPEDAAEGEAIPAAPFQMAARELSPAYSDAEALLRQWHSGSPDNVSGYASAAFDILLDSARASISPDVRDACLHDAEELLLSAQSVVPLFYYGTTSALSEELTGVYRKAGGAYFFDGVRLVEEESE